MTVHPLELTLTDMSLDVSEYQLEKCGKTHDIHGLRMRSGRHLAHFLVLATGRLVTEAGLHLL